MFSPKGSSGGNSDALCVAGAGYVHDESIGDVLDWSGIGLSSIQLGDQFIIVGHGDREHGVVDVMVDYFVTGGSGERPEVVVEASVGYDVSEGGLEVGEVVSSCLIEEVDGVEEVSGGCGVDSEDEASHC